MDIFSDWGVRRAPAILDSWPGAAIRPAKQGPRKGQHLKYGASYAFEGASPRELTVDKRSEKRGVTVFVNTESVEDRPYPTPDFPRIVVLERRAAGTVGQNGSPGIRTSVNRNATLQPRDNELLKLYVRDEESFLDLVRWYTGQSGSDSFGFPTTLEPSGVTLEANSRVDKRDTSQAVEGELQPSNNRKISLDSLLERLEANARIGRIGELAVLASERARVASEGCPDPTAHVKHTALVDAAAGYDIESRWADEVRFIEVKATTSEDERFFLSQNERSTLAELGGQAWLYRVRVFDDDSSELVERIRDPMAVFSEDAFEAVAWRVRGDRRR